MNITEITDTGTVIELDADGTHRVAIQKANIKLQQKGNLVYLYDNSESAKYGLNGITQLLILDFQIITSPVSADASALFNTLRDYIKA